MRNRAWEYAMSDGEGTLIEHGTVHHYSTLRKKQQLALRSGYTMIFEEVSRG